ncbi:Receptor kinase-like protein xa21 [Thalictrum thalictroides]|uniref:Receptor kinase-like protein xa21 n=1 Tax=Thalictrum thalictroides TaxID=46969 RepID=A0A7J6WYS7_THATH|nr:Receptor kinase-like protein xa21 [Thalictrum thalictroides]
MGGDASTQGDVYSYGVLLLELFTGRRPTDKVFIDGLNLHNFARMALPNRVLEVLDPALLSEEDVQSLSSQKQTLQEIIASLVRVGVACSSESPGERMNMEEVARDLNLSRDIFLASFGREHL